MWSMSVTVILLALCLTENASAASNEKEELPLFRFQEKCANQPSLLGYSSIQSLNEEIKYHASLLREPYSQEPRGRYEYNLCPGVVLDGSQQLTPLLDGTFVICGADGKAENQCIIQGGTTQVLLLDTAELLLEDAPVVEQRINAQVRKSMPEGQKVLVFRGITFLDSQDMSIAALASPRTRADFHDCHWEVCDVILLCYDRLYHSDSFTAPFFCTEIHRISIHLYQQG